MDEEEPAGICVSALGPGKREGAREVLSEDSRLEQLVNEDIMEFQRFFCSDVDPSTPTLHKHEVAILKTYLWWKLHPGERPSGEATSG